MTINLAYGNAPVPRGIPNAPGRGPSASFTLTNKLPSVSPTLPPPLLGSREKVKYKASSVACCNCFVGNGLPSATTSLTLVPILLSCLSKDAVNTALLNNLSCAMFKPLSHLVVLDNDWLPVTSCIDLSICLNRAGLYLSKASVISLDSKPSTVRRKVSVLSRNISFIPFWIPLALNSPLAALCIPLPML